MDTMRERFTSVTTDLLDHDPRIALVLADIGVGNFLESGAMVRHPERAVNVGIREQLMMGVGAGLALEGLRPIIHTYAPFLVERPFEQVKLNFAHQGLGAILVSVGASFDLAESGRTHQAPGDVALMATLPDRDIFVPGHPDEVEAALRAASTTDRNTYMRLSVQQNEAAVPGATEGLVILRRGRTGSPLVVAVGPTLDAVLEATEAMDVSVAYTARPFPLDGEALRRHRTSDVIWVEPYLEGTSAASVMAAMTDSPIRLRSIGVGHEELRRYGSREDHLRAWGLDAPGLRATIDQFLGVAS